MSKTLSSSPSSSSMATNPKETELPSQNSKQEEALDLALGLSPPPRPPTYNNVLSMRSNSNPNPNPNPNLVSSDPSVTPWPVLVQSDPYRAQYCLQNPNAYVMMPCWVAPDRSAMLPPQMQHINGNASVGASDLARAHTMVGSYSGGHSAGASYLQVGKSHGMPRVEESSGTNGFSGSTVEQVSSGINPSSFTLRPHRIAGPVPASIANGVSRSEFNGAVKRRLMGLSRTQQILHVTCSSGESPINGEAITVGLLYKYTSRDEVRISCLCHGTSFAPEEFARHAGCTDTSQALREIVVHVPLIVED